jgi:PAS domain S-box-containing protein
MADHNEAIPPLPEGSLSLSTWRQIVDGAVDTAIIATDPRGRVTMWSAGAERLFGWSEREMTGRRLDALFPEDDRARGLFDAEMSDALRVGRGGGEEGWRVRRDGSRFWAMGELSPIVGDDGRVAGFVKVVRDRTRQREAEQALVEETRALEVLNRANASLSRVGNLEDLVQIVTDAGVELTGAQFGAFFYNVLDPKGEHYTLYTLSGAPAEAFEAFPMPRNTKVFEPTFKGAGIVRSDDITKDGRYGHMAPHHGMPAGHLPVRSYLAVPVVSRSGEVLGGLFFGHEQAGVFTDRSERGLVGLAAETAVAIDNTRLAGAMRVEIAERRRAEEALRKLNTSLEQQVAERTRQLERNAEALRQSQKMEAIGQLTGGVAHDFNNLLQIVVSNLEAIRRMAPSEPARLHRAVESAMNGARRAGALTQRLLAFARKQPLDPKPIDANVLVSGMSELLHRTLGEPISVETVLGAGLWRIEVDPNELENALLNLAVNARDAMPDGGSLTIETANAHIDGTYVAMHAEVTPGQYVLIAVSDTGTGMDAATIAQAFEPFFTTKPAGHGTGLGLSQVYGFVKQSRGHVKIYSEVGVGTTVKIYLPRLLSASAPAEEPASSMPLAAAQGDVILVVEDDDDVRAATVESLRELGYRVIEAPDGPKALQALESEPRVKLLFTDVVLPGGMTGAQVAAEARGMRPRLKVLFTTGYARNAIVHQGRLDPGVTLISKPFSFDELAAKIGALLDDVDAP